MAGGSTVLPGICACRKCVGSHSPPGDLQARLQGAGRVNLRRRRISGSPTILTSQFRSGRRKEPFGKPNGEKTGDFERFPPFFRPCIFSEFHRSLLPFSMLCPDSDSRKGLFCVFPKAIGSVAGFGLAKAEPDSVEKPPLHKLFTSPFDPSSNCPNLNSRNYSLLIAS